MTHRTQIPSVLALSALTITFTLPQPAAASLFHRKQPVLQVPTPVQIAPVPPQIATAQRVFVINGGADKNFPAAAQTAYNDFYAALQQWGHYQLVSSPEQADLLFKLQDIAPVTGIDGGYQDYPATAVTSPAFRLTILDAHTNAEIWTVNSPVNVAWRKSTRAQWYSVGVRNLVSRVKVLANVPLTASEQADLERAPRNRHVGVLVAAGVAGAGLAAGLILHHEFENNVAAQNAAACKQNAVFCTAAVAPGQ